MVFNLDKKSGLISKDYVIEIKDNNGLFYFKENPNNKEIYFNLPAGIYQSDNNLFLMNNPKNYKLIDLPVRNHFKKMPKDLKIVYTKNPNKCSVDLNNNVAFFDYSFMNKPSYIKDFVYYHELGHYKYLGEGNESEKNCDSYAFNRMIKKGYNPSQIMAANYFTLTNKPTSLERKENIYLHTLKSYK